MTTDDARPNFFIILGLSPDEPWDEEAYRRALSEKRNQWSRQRSIGIKRHDATDNAQLYLSYYREIERVMRDPHARAAEREAARRERADDVHRRRKVIADLLEMWLEKGYLLEEEYERLRDDEALRADDTLRQRLEDAPRRPRDQARDDGQRLDPAIEDNLRRCLNTVRQPDLYAVLRAVDPEVGAETPAERLLEAADALYRKARHTADKGRPEVGATETLADIARQVLGSSELKRRHDASVRLWALDALLSKYESGMEIARGIDAAQFERFLREAAAQGIDIGVARKELISRFGKRGWDFDLPSVVVEDGLRAALRCPFCSHPNDLGAEHCADCGRALRGRCPRCDATVSGVARACSACGFVVGERDFVTDRVEQAEACLDKDDLDGAAGYASEARRLWPVPEDRSDDLAARIRHVLERAGSQRVALQEWMDRVTALMDSRSYRAAARLLREAAFNPPSRTGLLAQCEDAVINSERRCQDARAPGLTGQQRARLYQEALVFCADNDDALRELALISLSPRLPETVSAQGYPPPEGMGMFLHETELEWPPAEQGEVKIICAGPDSSPLRAGAEFPEADLVRYRAIARGTRDKWFFAREWLRRYTLVLVLHGRCYVGESRWYARGPEVGDLRTSHAGTSVRVTWTWPAPVPDGREVTEALVTWDDGAEIGDPVNVPSHHKEYVAYQAGAVTGRYDIPATGKLFVKVAIVVRQQGTAYVTSGVPADARRQAITLRYEVRPGLGRKAKLLLTAERLDQLPALVLRGRTDNQPASRNDKDVHVIEAGTAERAIQIWLEKDGRIHPRSCRLFVADEADDVAIRIIDPP